MGLIHIYCGDGKGKTTAAFGLAVRAAGAGMRVHILQLLKSNNSSELESIAHIPNITVSKLTKKFGFTFSLTQTEKAELLELQDRLIDEAAEYVRKNDIDMLIIDEFFGACSSGTVSREKAESVIKEKTEKTELVLTGRNPDEYFLSEADYISEIKCVRHPYSKGVQARKGIEF